MPRKYRATPRTLNGTTFPVAVGAAIPSNHIDWLWIFGGLFSTQRAITTFMDNSNRNWAMHVIDWMETHRSKDEGNR